jgi:short-subunit dehydrogenase
MPRYALVTGASSGIGLALAEALARRGRNLILVARQRDVLESVACEFTQRFGVEVLFRTCNLAHPTQLTGLVHELEQDDLQVDLLVNNAGLGTSGPFLDSDWGREQQQLEVNLLALTRLCHAVGNRMVLQGGGQILNVASVAAFQPGPWMSSYYAGKAYVLHLSEGLREELKGRGVKVSVLCPGPTRTAFFRGASMEMGKLDNSKLMMNAEELALYTVRALEKNRAIIIPGWRNRMAARSSRFAPRWLVRKLAGAINKRFTAQ